MIYSQDYVSKKSLEKNIEILGVYKKHDEDICVKCLKCEKEFTSSFYKIISRKFPCYNCSPRNKSRKIIESICEIYNFSVIENNSQFYCKISCNFCKNTKQEKVGNVIKMNLSCECAEWQKNKYQKIDSPGVIYKIISPSGRVYIGQTIRRIDERILEHERDAYREKSVYYDTAIASAIRKYGFNNFKVKILHKNILITKLDEFEKMEIENHQSNNKKFGYNLTQGGRGASSAKNVIKNYKKRINKKEELKKELNRSRAMNFGTNIEIELDNFIKEIDGKCFREHIKQTESVRRSVSAKKARHQPKTSQYRGVCWDKKIGKWKANIKVSGKKIHLGVFEDEKDAAIAYDGAARKYRGEAAVVNFPIQE